MKTIALRFSNNYAPEKGMIYYHQEMINKLGYVMYGKFGNNISSKVRKELMELKEKKILLINSGTTKRYWFYFENIYDNVDAEEIPEYYRNDIDKIKCWFKINKIEEADSKIMSKCFICSNNQVLSLASKYSMSPYFIINYEE